jgi:hypothetical protein
LTTTKENVTYWDLRAGCGGECPHLREGSMRLWSIWKELNSEALLMGFQVFTVGCFFEYYYRDEIRKDVAGACSKNWRGEN